MELIGRKQEKLVLQEALASKEAEMVAVLGRRRIGKTFLVTTMYQGRIAFEMSGTQGASVQQQLRNFRDEISNFARGKLPLEVPEDWLSAFQMLRQYLTSLDPTDKQVIFFDELPWLAGAKSGFLEALGYFWNSWASRQNIVVVICGSATSWMIRKVVHNKGGLHNRITKRVQLQPFTLLETEQYLANQHIALDRFQILHLYMAMGGVPHYLKAVKAGQSAAQNIDRICFSEGGLLRDEFSKLYPALFKQADKHIAIIRALASKWKGMDRAEILEKSKSISGGGITSVLEELEQSGFITSYYPYGKKRREKIFRLTDAYSLFYLHFIETNKDQKEGVWQQLSQSQAYKSWSGYAFENICLTHLAQIKKAMGISGVFTQASAFYKKNTPEMSGAQIDLVLDRKDHIVNLFEMKFYNEPYMPTKTFADSLRAKRSVFKETTGVRKQLSWVLLTAYGMQPNQHSIGLVDINLTVDALFEELG